jgi:MSHA biogenesis protein MshP
VTALAAPKWSRGFALVPALFLVVVLGALALIAIRVGTGQQQAVTLNLLQTRALAAARAGIEWGSYRALKSSSCVASTSLSLTEASLNGFSVIVTCSATAFANGAAILPNSYVINAAATFGTYGQPAYVHRVVSATLTDATS